MTKSICIRSLEPADIEDFQTIRLSALKTAPEAFGSVHAEEAGQPLERHMQRLAASQVFVAYAGDRIVGMVGLRAFTGPKDAHKAYVWGFYIEPDFRKSGVGTALLSALVKAAHASVEQVTLAVVETNVEAIGLYERLGFTRYGVEPRALKDENGYSDEVLMILFLDSS